MTHLTKDIRNVVLLGHSGSGKTTLNETMLFEAGAIHRKGQVEAGNTVSDFTDIEKEKGNSLFSTLSHLDWRGTKINIMDTPGLDDFTGEVVSAVRVAATAVIVLNSKNGVEVGTELIWDYIDKFETPAFFVINQMDHPQADYEAALEQAQTRFGTKVLPVQFPLRQGEGFNAIVDALRMVMYVFPDDGGKPEKQPIPDSAKERAKAMHNALVEATAENDEGLMEKFFDKGTLSEEELAEGLRIAMAHHDFLPVFIASSERNMGSGRIMGFINDICPSPAERKPARLTNGDTLACEAKADTTIFIYKTFSEPRVGLLSYFKVYSGCLKSGDELINAQNGTVERFSQLYLVNGHEREPVDQLCAGDLGVSVKMKNSHTNNTLKAKGVERALVPIDFPAPRVHEALQMNLGKAEMEKLIKALHLIEEEDPTLLVEQSPVLKQTLLHGQGQLHLEMIKHRIEQLHGISMDFEQPRIPYRETITKAAEAHYRHKKQSGGAGQFAEVHLRIEPYFEGMPDPEGLSVRNRELEELPWGGTLAFYWCIVGGSIDNKFSNAIKKGVLHKMEEGPLTGSRVQDVRVCIFDGKMHPVDSNDMAFMLAAQQAFKEAFEKAAPKLLQPMYVLEVLCSEDVMGDVMTDLQSRSAMITGMDADGHYQKILARVPLAEMYHYSSALRSLTQGRAKFNLTFAEYAPVDGQKQKEIIGAMREQVDTEA